MQTFDRVEKKYLLTKSQYDDLMEILLPHLEKEEYFLSNIYNIYFDNDNYDLINTSIEKPIYKEKLRVRSYYANDENHDVFFEIKKKFKDVVNKRRITISKNNLEAYLNNEYFDKSNQVFKEIDYCFKHYNLKKKMFIAYDRYSYYFKDNRYMRVTFDFNLRYRLNDLNLNNGDGKKYFDEEKYIMEIKILGGMPMWLSDILSKQHIYSTSFSKYGSIYKKLFKEGVLC